MRAFPLGLAFSCLFAAAALAQAASDNGRYSMTPAQGGFLRLDTRTGEVAMCRPSGEGVDCRAATGTSPDSGRAALEAEIDRLARENADLKARLAGQDSSAPSRSREEIDRALDAAERFMRRMMRIMREEAPADRT